MKNEKLVFKVLNAFAFTAMVAINAIAQILPLGGYNTGEISALYPNLLTPAPITFSIWGIIYILLAVVIIQQFVSTHDGATKKIGWMFAITCALNIAWIVFWHFQLLLLATMVIVVLWVFLMRISSAVEDESGLLKAAFRIYYGWITAAAAVQVYILLLANLPGLGARMPAVIVTIGALVILTAFGLGRILAKQDSFFGIALAWAITGVFIKHVSSGSAANLGSGAAGLGGSAANLGSGAAGLGGGADFGGITIGTAGFGGAYPAIIIASGISAALLLAAIIYMFLQTRKSNTDTRKFQEARVLEGEK